MVGSSEVRYANEFRGFVNGIHNCHVYYSGFLRKVNDLPVVFYCFGYLFDPICRWGICFLQNGLADFYDVNWCFA